MPIVFVGREEDKQEIDMCYLFGTDGWKMVDNFKDKLIPGLCRAGPDPSTPIFLSYSIYITPVCVALQEGAEINSCSQELPVKKN